MSNRDAIIAQVATLYYEQKFTQSEIAKKLHLSRPTISHMLNEAREKGIVTITINHPDSNLYSRQHEILNKFNLKSVHIANSSSSEETIKRELGQLCSSYIESRIDDIKRLGLGWGTSIYEFVNEASYRNTNGLEIIPLIGGIGIQDTQYHSNHLAFRLSEKYNCDVSYFYAPAFAESEEVRNLFASTVLYQDIYKKGLQVDIAILGVGNPIESSTYKTLGYFSNEEEEQIKQSGAIGDVLGSFFDKNGETIDIPITRKMMGITLVDIRKIPEILVIASGNEKIDSILTLLKLGVLDHLVIDREIANGLLKVE